MDAPARRLRRVAAALVGAAAAEPPPAADALRSLPLPNAAGCDSLASMRERFDTDGVLVFPAFLSPEHIARISADMDAIPEHHRLYLGEGDARHWWGTRSPGFVMASVEGLGGLTSHPTTLALLGALAFDGFDFAIHHAHAHIHERGDLGQEWHQDYEQNPQSSRDDMMCHCFYYLQGLNGEVGDLAILRGSHKIVMERGAMQIFGFEDLPGCQVFDDVPPGTMMIVHSALVHARRPKPGGSSRYFANVGYCSGGSARRWPAYTSMEEMGEINAAALANGHAREGEGLGSMAFLFEHERVFADTDADDAPWGPLGPLRLPPGTESEEAARSRWEKKAKES